MSTEKLGLIKTDSMFLETVSNCVTNGDGRAWFYMPFWFEKISDGYYVQYSFDDLPKELKEEMERFHIKFEETHERTNI